MGVNIVSQEIHVVTIPISDVDNILVNKGMVIMPNPLFNKLTSIYTKDALNTLDLPFFMTKHLIYDFIETHFFVSKSYFLIIIAGFPATMQYDGTSFVTTLPAATIDFFPMWTPGIIKAP